jgi:hypothetical protein
MSAASSSSGDADEGTGAEMRAATRTGTASRRGNERGVGSDTVSPREGVVIITTHDPGR